MGHRRVAYRLLVGKPEGKILLKDLGVDGRILKCNFQEDRMA